MSNENPPDINKYKAQVKSIIDTILYIENLPDDQAVAFGSGFDEAKEEAQAYLDQPTIKQRLCEVLTPNYNNVFDIGEKITEMSIGLVLAEVIVIPLNPLIFAWFAIIIFDKSVAVYCQEE